MQSMQSMHVGVNTPAFWLGLPIPYSFACFWILLLQGQLEDPDAEVQPHGNVMRRRMHEYGSEKGLNGRVSGVEGNGGVLAVREENAL